MTLPTLLHLIPAGGGGTERCVRELADGLPQYRHLLLHLGPEAAALEDPQLARFVGLRNPEPAAFERFARGLLATYRVSALHLHLVGPQSLPWMQWLPRLGIGYAITLHDLGFLSAGIFAADGGVEPAIDRGWIACLQPLFAGAFVVTSPSAYVDSRFRPHFRDVECIRVEPGLREPCPEIVGRERHPRPTVGIIGALGPHKGADLLEAVWALPQAGALRWVLLGYTENQLHPLQTEEPEIIVHGPFEHSETAALVDRYQIDLVWFPNRLAESFSYALSECWAAGRAALVPRWGALGERVGEHGGGWISSSPAEPVEALAEIEERTREERALDRRAEHLAARASRVPGLTAMLQSFRLLYGQMPMTATAADEPWSQDEVAAFLETQLGPLSFRKENIRLARDYGQVRIWATQLEGSVLEFRNDRDRWFDEFTRQSAWLAQVTDNLATSQTELAAWVERGWAAEAALGSAQGDLAVARELHANVVAQAEQLRVELMTAIDRADAATAWGVELDRRLLVLHAELAAAQLDLKNLAGEIAPLRIKGSRYDRVLAWVPRPLQRVARWVGARRRAQGKKLDP